MTQVRAFPPPATTSRKPSLSLLHDWAAPMAEQLGLEITPRSLEQMATTSAAASLHSREGCHSGRSPLTIQRLEQFSVPLSELELDPG